MLRTSSLLIGKTLRKCIAYVRNKLEQADDLADGFEASRWPSPLQPTAYAGIDLATLSVLTTVGRSRIPRETRLAVRIGSSIGCTSVDDLPGLFPVSRRFPTGHLGRKSGIGPTRNGEAKSTEIPRKPLVETTIRADSGRGWAGRLTIASSRLSSSHRVRLPTCKRLAMKSARLVIAVPHPARQSERPVYFSMMGARNLAKRKSVPPSTSEPDNTPPKRPSVRLDPEYVYKRLKNHWDCFISDVNRLRLGWVAVAAGKWPNHEQVTAIDYLRSNSLMFATSNCSARHPFILDYCRTLGANPDPIDRLFQRVVFGDITDKRAVESDADQAMIQLDNAIKSARRQWLRGDPVIHNETGDKPKSKRPRKKANNHRLRPEVKTFRTDILERWDRAKAAGTRMKDFCEDERKNPEGAMSLSYAMLRKFVSWRSQRRKRGSC